MAGMEDTQFWGLAARFLAGEASEREVETLRACIAADPDRRAQLAEAVEARRLAGGREGPEVDVPAAWNRLERRIEREESGAKRLSGARHRERLDRPGRLRRYTPSRRVPLAVGGMAVVLLAAVLAVLIWPEPRGKVLATERGARLSAELADGTHVELNAESRLTLVRLSGQGMREVHLEGEAFFEVTHEAHRPFLVRTREGVIRVVGTAFNVKVYGDEDEASVAVTEGAVALEVLTSPQAAAEDTVVLRPGQLGVVTGRRLSALRRGVDLTPLLAWREGRLVFENAPFPEVVRRLERWYDLQIEGGSLESVDRLNAVFDRESAPEVVRDIALALGLQYEQVDRRVRFYRSPSATVAPHRRPVHPRT